jgi:NADPH-dependent glutamate synthase beta subunit-like oxidoreductase
MREKLYYSAADDYVDDEEQLETEKSLPEDTSEQDEEESAKQLNNDKETTKLKYEYIKCKPISKDKRVQSKDDLEAELVTGGKKPKKGEDYLGYYSLFRY